MKDPFTQDILHSLSLWSISREQTVNMFSRQAIPMTWDFPEINPFAGAAGDFFLTSKSISKCIDNLPASSLAYTEQCDAKQVNVTDKVVSTDPPYYDNVSYAEL